MNPQYSSDSFATFTPANGITQDTQKNKPNGGPSAFAKTKAAVAKKFANRERASKKAGANDLTTSGTGLRLAAGGDHRTPVDASGAPVWLRSEFSESLRIEERQAEEVRLVTRELEYWRGRLVASKDAAEGRRAEVLTFDHLLSTQDATSDEDVRRSLQFLNDTIEQLAVQISKDFITNDLRYALETNLDKDRPRLKYILGDSLYDALETSNPKDEYANLLLRYAWQACINSSVARILRVFSVASPGVPEGLEVDDAFNKAACAGEEEECQPVHGHWRAKTHRYLRLQLPQAELERRLNHYAQDSLTLCHLATAMLSNEPSFGADWMNKVQSRLTLIMDGAWRLATMIREDCITKNFSVYQPRYEDDFDLARMSVDDPIDIARAKSVVCTIRLGMVYSSKPGRERGPTTTNIMFQSAQVLSNGTLDDVAPRLKLRENELPPIVLPSSTEEVHTELQSPSDTKEAMPGDFPKS